MKTQTPIWQGHLKNVFGLDIRALALVRIALALGISHDLWIRLSHLTEHYGNFGVFPKTVWENEWKSNGYWSLHLLSGSPEWSFLLFILHAGFVFFLLIGFKTRIATIGVWLLLVSLHNANPFINQGSDAILRIFLLICIFLPLGKKYSIDALRNSSSPKENAYQSPWTAVYIFQVALIYFTSGISKNGELWQQGNAVYVALSRDHFRTSFGSLIYMSRELMTSLTYVVHFVQYLAPYFLLSPYKTVYLRTTAVFTLMLMHIGLGLSVHLGPFTWVTVTILAGLLPGSFFDFAELAFKKTRVYGRFHAFFSKYKRLPVQNAYESEPQLSRIRSGVYFLTGLLATLFISFSFLQDVSILIPESMRPAVLDKVSKIAALSGTNHTWNFFAPEPTKIDGWIAVRGVFSDGSTSNLFPKPHTFSLEEPSDIARASFIQDIRIQKYVTNLLFSPQVASHASYYADYMCRHFWSGIGNDTSVTLERVDVIAVKKAILESGKGPATHEVLATSVCASLK